MMQIMILADKIINERKKCGWSQEELAEKLNVSRQSVSKWEGAQATPDIQKILKMAELFGVSTDYLLKDELEPDEYVPEPSVMTDAGEQESIRKVSLEEANEFLSIEKSNSRKIANGVSLCIASPVLLVVLSGFAEQQGALISEGLAVSIGMAVMFALIAAAVYTFIVCGAKAKPYEFIEKVEIETAYGVDGMVKEKRKAYAAAHSNKIAVGVILCVLSAVPLIVAVCTEASDSVICAMVGVLLTLVAIGVNRIVRTSIVWSSYDKLLQENEYTKREKLKSKNIDAVASIYWCVVTAGYLAWSFITNGWDRTWIVWPVAGVLYAVVEAITKALTKGE